MIPIQCVVLPSLLKSFKTEQNRGSRYPHERYEGGFYGKRKTVKDKSDEIKGKITERWEPIRVDGMGRDLF